MGVKSAGDGVVNRFSGFARDVSREMENAEAVENTSVAFGATLLKQGVKENRF